jgi:hypothetical protein
VRDSTFDSLDKESAPRFLSQPKTFNKSLVDFPLVTKRTL